MKFGSALECGRFRIRALRAQVNKLNYNFERYIGFIWKFSKKLIVEKLIIRKFRIVRTKKCGTLHDFACHPCAGAMLIFSVSFQF